MLMTVPELYNTLLLREISTIANKLGGQGMSAIDTLREYAEVWRLFGSMPDDATLSAEVSASLV